MKRVSWKRQTIAWLCLILMLASMGSALAGLPGLDPALSAWLEQDHRAVYLQYAMEVKSWLPFSNERLAMMNRLLGHFAFLSSMEADGEDSVTTLAVTCGNETLYTLTERETAGVFTAETSALPNRVLESRNGSVMDMLSGASQAETDEPLGSFDLTAAISGTETLYHHLISACEPFAEMKRANYKIKDIGTSKWSQIARLTPEQSDGMLPLLREVLQCGMDEAFCNMLSGVRFGKGFIVGLYKLSENGDDLALYMKGDIIFPDGSRAKLSYQWAFADKNAERKDTFKYELVKSSRPAMSRVIAASLTRKNPSGQIATKGSIKCTLKAGGVTTQQTQTIDLSGKAVGTSRTLKGSVSRQVKLTESGSSITTETSVKTDLAVTEKNDGAVMSGTISVENKIDKAIALALHFVFEPDVPGDFVARMENSRMYAVTEETGSSISMLITDDGDVEPAGDPSAGLVSVTSITVSGTPVSSVSQNAEADLAKGMFGADQAVTQTVGETVGETGSETPDLAGGQAVGQPLPAVHASQGDAYLVGNGNAPAGMNSYTTPENTLTISLDIVPDTVRMALCDEMSQNLARNILLALKHFPEEDLALFQNGMTEEDFGSFLSLLALVGVN